MESITNGLSQGSFTLLNVLDTATGNMTDIMVLLANAGGGGTVASATLPLSISGGVISLDLTAYTTTAVLTGLLNGKVDNSRVQTDVPQNALFTDTVYTHPAAHAISQITGLQAALDGKLSTSHEAANVGSANVAFGAFNLNTRTLTLQNSAGVTSVLSVDNGGNLNTGATGVITTVLLAAWAPLLLKLTDSGGTVRNLEASVTGTLVWNGSTLVDLTYLSSNFSTTSSINTSLALKANDAAVATGFAGIQVQLAGKVDDSQVLTNVPSGAVFTDTNTTYTAGAGLFLSGTTFSGYDLRWSTNSTPSTAIECLRFEGLTVTETFNLTSGQTELVIDHPSSHPIAMITGLQDQLDKITDMADGPSAVSLGIGTGAGQRLALYEIPNNAASGLTPGHYFYGFGLLELGGSSVGTAIWGGTAAALPRQNSSSGLLPHLLVNLYGNVSIGNVTPSERLHVTGNILASGSITGATKSFDIAHPDPSKPEMRLRHWVTETDEPGGSLLYRRQVDATQGNNIIQMPDWFKHLATNVLCVASPVRHFGLCWADLDNNDSNCIVLGTSKAGIYNVIVTAKRNDICATTMCPQEVQYKPAEEIPGDEPFPSHM